MKTILSIVALLFLGSVMTCGAADGQEIWTAQCAQCHGADGKGQTPMGKKLQIKDFTDAKVQAELKDDDIVRAIMDGRKSKEGKTLMRPAENVTDNDIKMLVQIVRGFKR